MSEALGQTMKYATEALEDAYTQLDREVASLLQLFGHVPLASKLDMVAQKLRVVAGRLNDQYSREVLNAFEQASQNTVAKAVLAGIELANRENTP